MTRERFEELVQQALATIPRRFRQQLKNIAVIVEDRPSAQLLGEMAIDSAVETLFGLYRGTPLPSRRWDYGNTLPDTISIFQRPIEQACDDEEQIVQTIGETLIHEIGHYFGLSEDEIRQIEEMEWRGGRKR